MDGRISQIHNAFLFAYMQICKNSLKKEMKMKTYKGNERGKKEIDDVEEAVSNLNVK